MPSSLLPLRPYEPYRDGQDLLEDSDGQLELTLLATPEVSPGAAGRTVPPLELRQVRAVLTMLLEVRTGNRGVSQIQPLVQPRLYRRLRTESPGTGGRYTLKTVHGCRPARHVVEACGTAHRQGHAYAVVARFELTPQGWRCALFEVVRGTGK